MNQLANIHRHRWKERLNNKVAKFDSDTLKTDKDMHPQSRGPPLYAPPPPPPIIQTSVTFRDFASYIFARF